MSARVPLVLTQAELDGLLDYSCSVPTGTTIGKRWKRNTNFGRPGKLEVDVLGVTFVFPWPEQWVVGEYVEHPDPKLREKRVGIVWHDVVIMERSAAA